MTIRPSGATGSPEPGQGPDLVRGRTEELDPVPVRVTRVDDVLVLFPNTSHDRKLTTAELHFPRFYVGDAETEMIKLGPLANGFVEWVTERIEIEFNSLGGTGELEMDPLAAMFHRPTLMHPKAEFTVEPEGSGEIANSQAVVDELDRYLRHRGTRVDELDKRDVRRWGGSPNCSYWTPAYGGKDPFVDPEGRS
jgi:hypothetical protein